jgi:predicted Rossmann fold flavoprotein
VTSHYDIAILGAGASGMMTAARLRDRASVVLLEGNPHPGAKIAVSGGGRCNLCNLHLDPSHYRGEERLLRAVFSRYDQHWLRRWFHERGVETRPEKGAQLFCRQGASAVVRALRQATEGASWRPGWRIESVEREHEGFLIRERTGRSLRARRLVVASGGLSFPRLGASDIGLRIAEGLGHSIVRPAPALVGWTLQPSQAFFKELSGIATEAEVRVGARSWRGRILFAHRGLSGPAVLNASLWWERGEVSIDFLPGFDLGKIRGARKQLSTLLPLPRRLTRALLEHLGVADRPAASLEGSTWRRLERLHDYRFAPAGTFGYSKAEVTRGGVATVEVDPETLESRRVPGLYFVGEVLDVTGELGGYNFQWAFSSAAVCAEALDRERGP